MPPRNFFGSLGNTNFLRTHGTSLRSSLNLADDTRFPAERIRLAFSLIGGQLEEPRVERGSFISTTRAAAQALRIAGSSVCG
jgi:hypothetical protein